MPEIKFNITKEDVLNMPILDFEAFERIQDGQFRSYRLRPAIARFMVDDAGRAMEYRKALALTETFTVKHLNDFVNQFFKVMQDTMIPKENGNSSSSISEAEPAASGFPDGSQP